MSGTGLDINVLKRRIKELEAELEDLKESTRSGASTEADYIEKLEAENARLKANAEAYVNTLRDVVKAEKRAEVAERRLAEAEKILKEHPDSIGIFDEGGSSEEAYKVCKGLYYNWKEMQKFFKDMESALRGGGEVECPCGEESRENCASCQDVPAWYFDENPLEKKH